MESIKIRDAVAPNFRLTPPEIPVSRHPARRIRFLKRHWRASYFFLTLFLDQSSLVIAYLSAYMMRFGTIPYFSTLPSFYRILLPCASLMLFATIIAIGGYRKVESISFQKQVEIVSRAVLFHAAGLLAFLFLSQGYEYSRLFLAAFFMFLTTYLFIARIWTDKLNQVMSDLGYGVQRACILGVGHSARKLFQRFYSAPRLGYNLCGFVEMQGTDEEITDPGPSLLLGSEENLEDIIDRWGIEQIFTLEWSLETDRYDNIVALCEKKGVGFKYISPATESLFNACRIDELTGIPLVVRTRTPLRRLNSFIISVFDRIMSIALILLLLPLFAAIAAAIKFDSHGPVFFRQNRLTEGMKEFTLYKFRTMISGADARKSELALLNESTGPIFKIRNDPRITRVGRFLRKYSIDELPQLFNVVLGQMSLVGPRPPLRGEVEKYKTWQLQRLKTRQGMTGLWQVSGRSELTFEEMVLLDLYYIENRHFLFNLEILISTLPPVLGGQGAY